MPFRIDIGEKENTNISLQVVRNQINFYFQGNDYAKDEPYRIREDFAHLCQHLNLDGMQPTVRGKDPEHVKRHHTHMGETKIPHYHIGFCNDVNLQLLGEFLGGILKAQREHMGEENFQFISRDDVYDVLTVFGEYYIDYYGSDIQKQYLFERQLTLSEKESLINAAQSFFQTGILTKSDETELKKCGFETPEPPAVTESDLSKMTSYMLNLGLFGDPETIQQVSNSQHEINGSSL